MPSAFTPESLRQRRIRRVHRLAAILGPLCLVVAMVLPVAVIAASWTLSEVEMARRLGLLAVVPPPLSIAGRGMLVAALACPALLFARGLLHARRTLRRTARGQFFAGEAVAGLRAFAAWSCAAALAGVATTPIGSLLLTYGLGPGHRHLVVDLGSGELLQLLSAGLMWVTSDLLAEAQALADENAQFV